MGGKLMKPPMIYCIRIKGHLPSSWSFLLEGLQVTCEPEGRTALCAPIRDQAELYGLITHLQNLGITLISINPLPEDD
jgi:hypothetical protein